MWYSCEWAVENWSFTRPEIDIPLHCQYLSGQGKQGNSRNESQGMSAKSSLRINFFSSIWDVSISTIPLSCSSTTASVRPFSSEMLVDDPDGDIFFFVF